MLGAHARRAAPEVELALVQEELRVREASEIPDVVVVEVRDDDLRDGHGRHAELS